MMWDPFGDHSSNYEAMDIIKNSMTKDGFRVKVHKGRLQYDSHMCGWYASMIMEQFLKEGKCLHNIPVMPEGIMFDPVTRDDRMSNYMAAVDYRQRLRDLTAHDLLTGELLHTLDNIKKSKGASKAIDLIKKRNMEEERRQKKHYDKQQGKTNSHVCHMNHSKFFPVCCDS
jgi:hypothetical protein